MVDVFNDFDHEDGDRLLDSFRERAPKIRRAIDAARSAGVSVVYVNDEGGSWQHDAPRVVRAALRGRGGELLEGLVPVDGEPMLLPASGPIRSSSALRFATHRSWAAFA